MLFQYIEKVYDVRLISSASETLNFEVNAFVLGLQDFCYTNPVSHPGMGDNLMDKVSAFGERLKIGGSEVSRKMTAGMSSVSTKMKDFFQVQNQAEKIVEDATSENLDGPNWSANLEICDMINSEKFHSVEFIRGIKKRIMLKNPTVQYLALVLLETCVKNCEKAFSEVAAERVLDEMVKLIDDPQTVVNNRNKALVMIEAWGESGEELRYLPVFEETYKKILSKYEELRKPPVVNSEPEPAVIPVAVEPEESPRATREDALIRKPQGSQTRSDGDDGVLDDLDEMIFGKIGGSTSEDQNPKKQHKQQKGDLMTF
ncbi:hypothetical protein GW17_00020608 [Ensete ventricosum]|nr:hypothetical protein GW17_00020608 [Ensete ventricosum]